MSTIKLYSHLGNSMRKYFLAVGPVCIFPNVSWDFTQPKTKKKSTSHQSKGIRACHCKSNNTTIPVKKIYPKVNILVDIQVQKKISFRRIYSQWIEVRHHLFGMTAVLFWLHLLYIIHLTNQKRLQDTNIGTKHKMFELPLCWILYRYFSKPFQGFLSNSTNTMKMIRKNGEQNWSDTARRCSDIIS